ncbi:MAG: flavin reductase family protein [Isosphaeraceae bacterium]
MSQFNSEEQKTRVGQALGRIPSGLFIVTARLDDQSTGMLASWVQQIGFEPPMVIVGVKKNRYITHWLERHPFFALNQLGQGQKEFLKHFGAGFAAEANAFAGISTEETEGHRSIVLKDAMSFMECHLANVFETGGDHDLVVARVINGAILNADIEPSVHLRKSGFHY